jgi:erythronate-4-phosphate dehydrogenase
MLRVVADQDIPYLRGVLEPHAEVRYLPGRSIGSADVKDADALIVRTRTNCDAALLNGSAVRFIASATIGFDHIDTAYCAEHGITWTNAPGCNASSVRQYIGAALLHVAERRGLTLAGMTLGVVGVGNVGSKVAELGKALGMHVLLNDPPRARREGYVGFVDLSEVIRRADIVTVHVPLTATGPDRTLHLFDGALLQTLAPHQLLLNTSRGEVIDGDALKQVLALRTISGAVLDVWEDEPGIDLELMARCDLATPHIAGYSADGKANGTAMSVRALSKHFGLPLIEWSPSDVPPPATPVLTLPTEGLTPQQIIAHAVHATYDIAADDARLRAEPATFERQRTTHPFRREFGRYSILKAGLPVDVARSLAAAGFSLR